jgi:hypothetical protein
VSGMHVVCAIATVVISCVVNVGLAARNTHSIGTRAPLGSATLHQHA